MTPTKETPIKKKRSSSASAAVPPKDDANKAELPPKNSNLFLNPAADTDRSWSSVENEALQKAVVTFLEKKKSKGVPSPSNAGQGEDTRRKRRAKPVNWTYIASSIPNRFGAECKVQYESLTGVKTVVAQWTKAEDKKVLELIKIHGAKQWSEFARKLPGRTGKQCRERFHNHLNPDIVKNRAWSAHEDRTILKMHIELGNHWAAISRVLPGRTDNAIKNHWNSFVLVRIEKYLSDVLKLKPAEMRDHTNKYLIPSEKLDDCFRYISNLTGSQMAGVKRQTKTAAALAGSTPQTKLPAELKKPKVAKVAAGKAPAIKATKIAAKKPVIKVATKASRVVTKQHFTKGASKKRPPKSTGKEIPSALPVVATGKRKAPPPPPPALPMSMKTKRMAKTDPTVANLVHEVGPLQTLQKESNVTLPTNASVASRFELEQLGRYIRTLRGGYINGVYVTALERLHYIRSLQVNPGSVEHLRLLNLSHDELERLPSVFRDKLRVDPFQLNIQQDWSNVAGPPQVLANTVQVKATSQSPGSTWNEEDISFLAETLMAGKSPSAKRKNFLLGAHPAAPPSKLARKNVKSDPPGRTH